MAKKLARIINDKSHKPEAIFDAIIEAKNEEKCKILLILIEFVGN